MSFLRKAITNIKAGYRASAKIGSPVLAKLARKKHHSREIVRATNPAALAAGHKYGALALRETLRRRVK